MHRRARDPASPMPLTPRREPGEIEEAVPHQLRLAAAIAWRVVIVLVAILAVALALAQVRLVVLPVVFALFIASALAQPVRGLRRLKFPPAAASATALVGMIVILGGLVTLIAPHVAGEFGDVRDNVREGTVQVTDWLLDGPLDLSRGDLERYREQGLDELEERSGDIAGGVIGGAYLAIEIVAGVLLTLVLAFFFLKDGDRMWPWVVGLFPPLARARVDDVGRIGWATLGGYLRGVTLVAFVDAFFIALALWIIGVPLVLPLALLTFIGGFFPIVGAFTAGAAAALVALVSNGLVDALLVIAAVVAVQQIEGNILQPFVVSRAVKIHAVGVLLAVAAGAVIWGIVGAFLAVPVVAVISRAASHLRSGGDEAVETPST
jgi:predicted PurR-regulated permease PerM